MIAWLVLTLRGATTVLVMTTLVGGIPRTIQLGIALALGSWSALLIGSPPPVDDALVVIAARELVIGATLGIVAAIPLLAAAGAGRLVDVAATGRAQGPYAGLFGILAGAVFVGIDGHIAVVSSVVTSFKTVPAIGAIQPRVIDAIAGLVPSAVQLAVPWLVTVVIVELAVGAGMRLAGRAGSHTPTSAATPIALVMITATLVATLAVAIAALVRNAI